MNIVKMETKVTSKNLEEKILEAVADYELRWARMSEFDKWVIREINKQIDQGVAQLAEFQSWTLDVEGSSPSALTNNT